MGSVVSGLFGKGGGDISGQAVARARELAPGARFNPYTVRSGTGNTGYTGDGQFYSQLSQPYQDVLGTTLGGAQSLFGQMASFDPSARASEIFGEQAALLQPEFQRQAVDLQNQLFGSGRLGLRLAGESQGLGTGSGMVQPDALGLGQAQQQTLAQLASGARSQAFNEMGQLGNLGSQALQAGMGISGLEQSLMGLGLNAEQARAAAALGAGNLEMAPYATQAAMAQQQRSGNMGLFGGILGGLGGTGGLISALSDERLKDNIRFAGELDNGVNVYVWDWNDKAKELGVGNQPEYGVIAQEILEVYPEAVDIGEHGYYTVNYNHPALQGAQ